MTAMILDLPAASPNLGRLSPHDVIPFWQNPAACKTMSEAIIIVSVIAILLLCLYYSPSERNARARLQYLLEERPKPCHEEYCRSHFSGTSVTPELISTIRDLFDEHLGEDLRGLEPDDDLSGEYSLIWDMDSLADVEILVGLEKKFDIQITGAEAATLKSIRMIAELVAAKVLMKTDT